MYCKNCGNQLTNEENYCSKCGVIVDNVVDNNYTTKAINDHKTNKRSLGFWIGLFVGEVSLFIILFIISLNSIKNSNINGTDVDTFVSLLESNYYSV